MKVKRYLITLVIMFFIGNLISDSDIALLVGKWELVEGNPPDVWTREMEFLTDGTGRTGGNRFTWELRDNRHIILNIPGRENQVFVYSLETIRTNDGRRATHTIELHEVTVLSEISQYAIQLQAWFRTPRVMGGGEGSFVATDLPRVMQFINQGNSTTTIRTPTGTYVFATTTGNRITITGTDPINQSTDRVVATVNLSGVDINAGDRGVNIESIPLQTTNNDRLRAVYNRTSVYSAEEIEQREANIVVSEISQFAIQTQAWFRTPRVMGGGEGRFVAADLPNIMRFINQGNSATTITTPSGRYAFATTTGNQITITGTNLINPNNRVVGRINLDGADVNAGDRGINIETR
jgi:hypothetical protein